MEKKVEKTVYLEVSYVAKDILRGSLCFVAKQLVKLCTRHFSENTKKMFIEEYIFTSKAF